MKKYAGGLVVVLLAALIMTSCNPADEQGNEEPGETESFVTVAEEFIQLLAEGQYEEATQHFDATMEAELSSTALEELWEMLNEQAGKFIDHSYDSTEQVDGHQVVLINGLFEATDVVFSIAFNADEQIAGFYVQ